MLAFALRVLQGVLALGVVALLAWGAMSFGQLGEDLSPPTAVTGAERARTAREDFPRYVLISERDLFRRKVEKVEPPAPPVIEQSALGVELLGTLVRGGNEVPAIESPAGEAASGMGGGSSEEGTSDGTSDGITNGPPSLAILRDVDGKVRTLAQGDVFADEQAKLVAIERGRIVLAHGERLETVTLEESAVAARSDPARPAYNAPRDPAARAAAAKAAEIARMQREVQRRMREAMPQVGATQPATGKN